MDRGGAATLKRRATTSRHRVRYECSPPPTDAEVRVNLGKNFRLPLDATPTAYRTTLRIDLGEGRFAGTMEINVDLKSPRAAVYLHAVDLTLTDASAIVADVTGSRTIAARDRRTDAESETVTLEFPEALPAGPIQLQL